MKYLVLSDLHIGDGSSKDDFNYDKELINLLNDFMKKDVVLILNGDIFELVETNRVKEKGLIPFEKLVQVLEPEVIDDIVSIHKEVFEKIKEFSEKKKVIYIIGNHDYYILRNKKLKERVKKHLGNVEIRPYFYIDNLKVLVLHGNQFDVLNKFTYNKKTGIVTPPLGDFIVRYMMVNFDEHIKHLVPKDVIKDYDNVRPLLDVFNWFDHVKELYNIGEDLLEFWIKNFLDVMRSHVAKNWMKTNYPFLRFLSKLFLNNHGGIKLGELSVRAVMKLRNLRRSNYLSKISKKILSGKRKIKKDDLLGYEDGEDIFNVDLRGIVMGHIHHSDLDIFYVDGETKFYLNTGTWRPVVEKMRHVKNGFQKRAELTYAILGKNGKDIEISLNTTNKLEEISIA
ncbi:MAG: metallophosphoesterase [Thermotogaceae bacterium]|nr:metallophosphoesterase [Thermotogaceae bacterium]